MMCGKNRRVDAKREGKILIFIHFLNQNLGGLKDFKELERERRLSEP